MSRSLSVFAAAAESPSATALVAGDRTFSYAELAAEARGAAGWLRERSPDRRTPVAVVAHNDVPTLVMLHGLLATGRPAVLLHPRLTAPERDALLASVSAERPGGEQRAGVVPRDWQPGPVSDHEYDHDSGPGHDPGSDATAAMVFTSGTTGAARAVALSRRAIVASAAASAANLGWEADDRWLLPLPLAHVGGFSILTRCLLARRAVVLANDARAHTVLEAMHRHRVTLASLVPTVLSRLLDATDEDPPSSLRALLLGGAAASPELLGRAADRGWPVLTTYGLTEACSQVTTQEYGTVNRGERGAGRPLPGVELRIGDDDEIQLRGPTLFSGYVPPTAESPFLEGGWFQTGDRGRLDEEGRLHVLGRRVDRIVTGGENVDPAEVEQALEALPGVVGACVFGVPDEEWGEVVAAALVVEAGSAAVREGLPGLETRLAPFKRPRRATILDALPTNATGKVDRRETARRATPRLRRI